MSKRKEILWDLEDHSFGKHLVLKKYINAWFPILSKYNGRLLFIDGFAGPGEYKNGHVGSPVIALDAALHHRHAGVREQEIVFFFIENDSKRLNHLKDLIASRYPNLPSNFKVHFANSEFDEAMTDLLDVIAEQNKRLAPCFAMIDPFGVSDTPMSIVHRILENRQAEIYVSVMYEHINRFLSSKEFEPHLNTLFGDNRWSEAKKIENRDERKEFLYRLYKSQLKASKANNAIHFELFRGNRHVYSIFFATQSWLGTDKMKNAIWNIAPSGDFVFRGMAQDELDLASPNFDPLIDIIVSEFQNIWVTPEQIAKFVGSDRTNYHSSQFKKNALRVLEDKGQITVHPADIHRRKRKFTYPKGIRIMVSPRDQDA